MSDWLLYIPAVAFAVNLAIAEYIRDVHSADLASVLEGASFTVSIVALACWFMLSRPRQIWDASANQWVEM